MSDEVERAAATTGRRLAAAIIEHVVRVGPAVGETSLVAAALRARNAHWVRRADALGDRRHRRRRGVGPHWVESATYAMWVLGKPDRFARLNADYARRVVASIRPPPTS